MKCIKVAMCSAQSENAFSKNENHCKTYLWPKGSMFCKIICLLLIALLLRKDVIPPPGLKRTLHFSRTTVNHSCIKHRIVMVSYFKILNNRLGADTFFGIGQNSGGGGGGFSWLETFPPFTVHSYLFQEPKLFRMFYNDTIILLIVWFCQLNWWHNLAPIDVTPSFLRNSPPLPPLIISISTILPFYVFLSFVCLNWRDRHCRIMRESMKSPQWLALKQDTLSALITDVQPIQLELLKHTG